MITYQSEIDFELENQSEVTEWIKYIIEEESLELGDLTYVFCSDAYLYDLNVEFLQHDTLTDIISFDYRVGDLVNGEIYISIDRVKENAMDFGVSFVDELHRVIIHGVLHICGYDDLTDAEEKAMRTKEDWALSLRNFLKDNL